MYGMAMAQLGQEKLSDHVEFPISGLDMRDYVINFKESVLYDLYAVSNHMGNLNGGHYTAFCKNAIQDRWVHFDDSRVGSISAENVCSKAAYLLFYRRRH